MKLIHCADLHLDSRMESGLPPEKARERRMELLHTFTKMVDMAAEDGVEAILLCGDLFDAGTELCAECDAEISADLFLLSEGKS